MKKINNVIGYIARDMNNKLCIFEDKPNLVDGIWDIDFYSGSYFYIPENLYPEIEPGECKIITDIKF